VQSWVVFHRQYHAAFPVPYAVALVELEEGPRIEGRVVGTALDDLRWRMPVDVVWDERDGTVVPAFRALTEPEEEKR
jgi:uncharacterized OB-fold protein